jgi:6-phospho-beta-glucosidase
MKLAVIGAGSTYTPELVSGLACERDRLEVSELVLHDIDQERREVVGGLAGRILERQGYAGSLQLTGDLDRALDGAGAVLIQIRVGGQAARLRDETIPAACGCVGQETTGAGGLAKAWRTVPVVLEIASRAREIAASDAWIVDFTNPVGIVTRALFDAGHRAVGLCNVAINFQRLLAARLGVGPERVLIEQVGLNHLTWIRAVYLDGRDVLGEVLSSFDQELADEIGLSGELIRALGAIPSYYLRYFYAEREVVHEQRHEAPRAQTVAEIERGLLELYRDPALTEKPKLLDRRGGAHYSEAAIALVASLTSDGDDVQVVDVRNQGALPGLADDDVVEVPAHIRASGPLPLPQRPLAPELHGLVAHVAAYERLAAAAAVNRDLEAARLALLAHPLVREWELADGLLERLVMRPERSVASASRSPGGRAAGPGSRAAGFGGTDELLLAVDAGNMKTDLALVRASGKLLGLVRGGRGTPQYLGLEGCIAVIEELLGQALMRTDRAAGDRLPVAAASIMAAGADLPEEVAALRSRIELLGWGRRLVLDNDTVALLRSGTDRGWGIAVVCGSGINCIGIAPDGRQARFPAFGPTTGDWGGGGDVGMAALMAAARSADGRGSTTGLESAVPAQFGFSTPFELARAVHVGALSEHRLKELAPVVLALAQQGDPVAASIVGRLADEVIALAATAVRRLELSDQSPDVVLGGGMLRAASPSTIERIAAGVRAAAPGANVAVSYTGPIVGAALLGLDELRAGAAAAERVRAELHAAFVDLELGAQGYDGPAPRVLPATIAGASAEAS